MSKVIVPAARIARSIFLLRGQKVMLDSDLAGLYAVPAGHLNRAVRRNGDRFPSDFIDAIRQLMAPPQKAPCEIGFHIRESAPRYRTRKLR